MHARRQPHLRQEHGAEFSGADLADTNGFGIGGARLEQGC
jgi:hypothetical protein